jgi:hypothetical protein
MNRSAAVLKCCATQHRYVSLAAKPISLPELEASIGGAMLSIGELRGAGYRAAYDRLADRLTVIRVARGLGLALDRRGLPL